MADGIPRYGWEDSSAPPIRRSSNYWVMTIGGCGVHVGALAWVATLHVSLATDAKITLGGG